MARVPLEAAVVGFGVHAVAYKDYQAELARRRHGQMRILLLLLICVGDPSLILFNENLLAALH